MQALLTEYAGHRAVIALHGDLDLATPGDELLARLPALNDAASGPVALDLSGISFLDCSGLRALLALEQRIHREGGELYVCAESPAVTRIFELLTAYPESCDLSKRHP
jgi:anti-sigma B factor antagonist